MPREPMLNKFVDRQAARLHQASKEAKKVNTPPLGMENVTPEQFRRRFPRIGQEERRAAILRLATPEDPQGVHALMRLLKGDHDA